MSITSPRGFYNECTEVQVLYKETGDLEPSASRKTTISVVPSPYKRHYTAQNNPIV
jgi:hypothetical protein